MQSSTSYMYEDCYIHREQVTAYTPIHGIWSERILNAQNNLENVFFKPMLTCKQRYKSKNIYTQSFCSHRGRENVYCKQLPLQIDSYDDTLGYLVLH